MFQGLSTQAKYASHQKKPWGRSPSVCIRQGSWDTSGEWGDGQDTASICGCTCRPLLSARGLINILRQQKKSCLTSAPGQAQSHKHPLKEGTEALKEMEGTGTALGHRGLTGRLWLLWALVPTPSPGNKGARLKPWGWEASQ